MVRTGNPARLTRRVAWVVAGIAMAVLVVLAVVWVREPLSLPAAPLPHAPFTSTTGAPAPVVEVAGGPNRLLVPSLSIDAPVDVQQMDDKGVLTGPSDPSRVGWDLASASPSAAAQGSTLLAGHVNMAGQRGALWDLAQVTAGAQVSTFDATGIRTDWVVTSLEAADKDQLPSGLAATDGPRRLVIVTCGGEVHDGEYAQNVIVTATPAAAT